MLITVKYRASVPSVNPQPFETTGVSESFISASLRLGNMFRTFPTDYIHVVVCDMGFWIR
jgi:hypothetical protein